MKQLFVVLRHEDGTTTAKEWDTIADLISIITDRRCDECFFSLTEYEGPDRCGTKECPLYRCFTSGADECNLTILE